MMTESKTIQELERELREMRSALQLERGERQRVELIRTEVAKRSPRDAATVEAMISSRTRPNANGDLVGVDEAGHFAFGTAPGAYQSVTDILDELSTKSPDLFSADKQSSGQDDENPFVQGKNYNVTRQMMLMSTDPERAAHLQYMAALGKY